MRGEIELTSLERAVESVLKELVADYEPQYSTRTGFVVDFAVPSKKIAIEVDGEKWHSSPEARKRDAFKDSQLRREGWKLLRIKEGTPQEVWVSRLKKLLGESVGDAEH